MNASETLSYLSSLWGRVIALTDDDKLFIEQLHTQIMSKPFVHRAGCVDCYKDALIELQIKIRNSGMEKQKYQLLNGVVLYDHKAGQYYTNVNLTDKIAAEYLKRCPSDAKLFATMPEPASEEPKTEDEEPLMDQTPIADVQTDPAQSEPASEEPKTAKKRKPQK